MRTPTKPFLEDVLSATSLLRLQVAVHEAITEADAIAFCYTMTGVCRKPLAEISAWSFDRAIGPGRVRRAAQSFLGLLRLSAMQSCLGRQGQMRRVRAAQASLKSAGEVGTRIRSKTWLKRLALGYTEEVAAKAAEGCAGASCQAAGDKPEFGWLPPLTCGAIFSHGNALPPAAHRPGAAQQNHHKARHHRVSQNTL